MNPFYIVDKITNGKIEFLIDFIWLLWGGEDEISRDERSILHKIIVAFYHIDLDSEDDGGFVFNLENKDMNIVSFYDYLKSNTKEINSYFDNDKSMFNMNSLLLNLEKFSYGTYKNLEASSVL